MKFLLAVAVVFLVGAAHAEAPKMATGVLPEHRSHAECLDYSAKVMRVLENERILVSQWSVYGSIVQANGREFTSVIRCETGAKAVFFAVAGGDRNKPEDGAESEKLVQVLMRQFEITKNLPKCGPHSSDLHLCQ
jgi:hypothetical protein